MAESLRPLRSSSRAEETACVEGIGLRPVLLFSGDSFLTEKKFEAAVEHIKKNVSGEVHVQSFHLTDTGIDAILAQTRNLPFLAQAQIFRIQDAETLKEKNLEPL